MQSGFALDLGCGSGEQSIWLAHHGFEVEGLDYSTEAIKIAQSDQSPVSFEQWDLEQLVNYPFKHNVYDLIIIRKVLAFLDNKIELLNIVKTKLNGVLILQVFLEHDEKPYVVSDKKELEKVLQERFAIVAIEYPSVRNKVVIADYYLKNK
ncbi:MAG: class I SAM-dependent methyltransferase [bacterium]|nr:class I SAM-dependent methyltransferase [bacterium]